ncbi:MAG: hypothetical protein JNL68_01565 [Burkholderiales bacterium]|nr:hypothetical protein [Burkholderiales bacterium]
MVPVSELRFDRENPRMPNVLLRDDDEVVRHLIDDFDVEELVQSILSSGWIDYEPLIAEDRTNVIFEGNRRLAALRLIRDAALRERVGYRLPVVDDPKTTPDQVRVRYVSNRRDARRFIAFKHINGPYKWDAFAKAKYAAEWLAEGEKTDVVSRMLGDNHNTIRRLVMGYNVLEQAQHAGFDLEDRTKKRFAFSHLYTAVSRPAVRSFLGVADDEDDVPAEPVPSERQEQLLQLMSWLYGQEKKKEPTVVVSQNPDLNQLVRVIENKAALASLIKYRRLDQAFEAVEPPASRFKDALIAANQQCENALALSSYFDGDETQLAMVKNLATTVRSLRDVMMKKSFASDDDL